MTKAVGAVVKIELVRGMRGRVVIANKRNFE
jgi:hypothetical protein